jgi:ubiquinone/menaquinone biosynthesis C-methylase UbiE
MDDKLIAAQLRQPSGELGKKVAENMQQSNAPLYRIVFEQMNIRADDQLLEIGFGNGFYLQEAARLADQGFVAGIDFSEQMVAEARQRNQALIDQQKIEIRLGEISALPYPADHFTKIYTLNTIYFWPEPEQDIREIYRVLRPGGFVYLGLRTAQTMQNHSFTQHGFRLYDRESVTDLLTRAGFGHIHSRHEPDPNPAFDCLCVSAEKEGSGNRD